MASVWSKVTQYLSKSVGESESAQHCRYVPPPVLRAELQIPPSVIESYQAGQCEDSKRERERSRIDRNRFRVEFATLVFAILAFGVLILTLCATWEAVETTRRQLELSERAWIGFSSVSVLNWPATNSSLRINAVIQNSGKTPALHVSLHKVFGPLRKAEGDMSIPFIDSPEIAPCVGTKPQWTDDLGGAVILPGDESSSINQESQVLSEEVVRVITSPKGTGFPGLDLSTIPTAPIPPGTERLTVGLYFVGCLNYFDQFHVARRTSFCYRYEPYEPPHRFIMCDQGNAAE